MALDIRQRSVADAFRIVVLITTSKQAKKAEALFEKDGLPLTFRMHADGTAPNEMLETLGLGGTERTLLVSLLPLSFARETMQKLKAELKLTYASNGIAFAIALTSASHLLYQIMDAQTHAQTQTTSKKDEKHMSNEPYSMILAIVDQGYSDMVMEAARPAGAAGGTVVPSRWLPNEETVRLWNISIQQEKEIVLILAENEKKRAIMEAIGEHCGMRSPAHGLLASVPVEDVTGI